ncbi:hypothetical protein [Inhella sp.]|uniref:hypothetical protein n=1 Tax=Inhella sp. TaxID=1921806 RepID=UPI0035B42F55
MRPFQDTHPGGLDTRPLGLEPEPVAADADPSMRLLGVLLGLLFALLHGYALASHGTLGAMALMGKPVPAESAWLAPWHGLWFLCASLGWLGLLGIIWQSWQGEPEDKAGGLRALVMAGLLSCMVAPMPWLLAPEGASTEVLGSPLSMVWLMIPLPFWLGWQLRVRELERAKLTPVA